MNYLVIINDDVNHPSYIMDAIEPAVAYAKQLKYTGEAKVYKLVEVACYTHKVYVPANNKVEIKNDKALPV